MTPRAPHVQIDPLSVPAPVELAWLTDLIGPAGAYKLIEAYGGTRIFVPLTPTARQPLARTIGLAAARRMADVHPAETIKVPLAKGWRARLYRKAGLSYTAIARQLGCGESAVHSLLQRSRMTNPEKRQTELLF